MHLDLREVHEHKPNTLTERIRENRKRYHSQIILILPLLEENRAHDNFEDAIKVIIYELSSNEVDSKTPTRISRMKLRLLKARNDKDHTRTLYKTRLTSTSTSWKSPDTSYSNRWFVDDAVTCARVCIIFNFLFHNIRAVTVQACQPQGFIIIRFKDFKQERNGQATICWENKLLVSLERV